MRRSILAAALAVAAGGAWAQDSTTRTITMIVPYPPGGNTDLMARALQPELSAALGQTIVVQNKGGAAGTLGTIELSRSRPDGLTIAMVPNNPVTAQPHIQRLPYAAEGLRYLCLVYDNPQVIVLGRDAPFKDFAGMVAHAKSGNEALIYGTPGQGSTQHLLIAGLLAKLDVNGLHVPFTGAGPMAQAALGGQIQVFVESATIPSSTGLPVLGVFSRERLSAFPEAPTLAELGHPMEGASHGGLVAPADTPDALAERIEKACETAVNSASFRAAAERLAAVPRFLPGAQFRERFLAESAQNKEVIAALGLGR
ncbi:tripartite tricarboxylate transporter substrate binding protein [Elioraea rosea]|uniref:tripartite tricarboxylate transporter substrate binding protein n=1 Tax=Elioraea rosea TaxID=2492390 RepID=UPI0011821003|nr:tripartite tricarboxylate transporter substrate binding protein [Elioraea rosea]